MSYKCYLFGELMPQTPSKLSLKISGKNSTVTLLNEGEINFLKMPGLTDITVTFVLPMFASEKKPDYYLTLFERAKTQKLTTQFIMTRATPSGVLLFDTNIKVSIEDYTVEENASNGFDLQISVKLKQYREYSTKTVEIKTLNQHSGSENSAAKLALASALFGAQLIRSGKATPTTYTTKKGDTAWSVAKKNYGKNYSKKIAALCSRNRNVLSNPVKVKTGKVLNLM